VIYLNKEIISIAKDLGLEKKDINSILSVKESNSEKTSVDTYKAGSKYGTVNPKEIYKAGTKYGTVAPKEIYKAGNLYGTISPEDLL